MPNANDVSHWLERIQQRYENYLKTSFFFKEPELRDSFQAALQEEGNLLKGPFDESARGFETALDARKLAGECFQDNVDDLFPALIDDPLYLHQEQAIRATQGGQNIVVATGTASGKTESFLYPILFELYRQYLVGQLETLGVRAMILYPMNALANDQRKRLGNICRDLRDAGSKFEPTFGQYIGQTPENARDNSRNATTREKERLPGELVFREEMRNTPPHILLTNYSMLEYLLIRPNDSSLFDNRRSVCWQFIVLDEAHQYRGAKGMEMGMLIRRLKQRLRDGGRMDSFRCIATSATISSGQAEEDKRVVAEFAQELFGEFFGTQGIIFGDSKHKNSAEPRCYHAFVRALEGAFLIRRDEADAVVLNRKSESGDMLDAKPLEIALCKECGQHYYVGRQQGGKLEEAIRDPSQSGFGVDYYLPTEDGDKFLCKHCGALSETVLNCDCAAEVRVKKCTPRENHADQLKQCETCEYQGGGDPVQEIVHGSDGPSTVIATALHELLPEDRRKVLAFTDSRQEAAFFAWYAEDSYEKLRDRNFILRALRAGEVAPEGLSIDDLKNRLLKEWDLAELFDSSDTKEKRNRRVLTSILCEAFTEEKRLSLNGVGLSKWFIKIPDDLNLPGEVMRQSPWNFTDDEAHSLVGYLLDELRLHRAMSLPDGPESPSWDIVSTRPQRAYCHGRPGSRPHVSEWGSLDSAIVKHFLRRLLGNNLSNSQKDEASKNLMDRIWRTLLDHGSIFSRGKINGTFRLSSRWLRIKPVEFDEIWECNICATLSPYNIRSICPRNRCPGDLKRADQERLRENHYRILYESQELPPKLSAEEHTAQIDSEEARRRQDDFKNGSIHLLSSSTTFEVGVDLGDLEVVFLRNVPPEPFNYTQRAGRAGRRQIPGLALTYCRRNPHDLYHYGDPLNRIVNGIVHPPRLRMTNEKIILRHMVATALSAFFRENAGRFDKVENFVVKWSRPSAVLDLKNFCKNNNELRDSLRHIVPVCMYDSVGLADDIWIDKIAGLQSRFASVEKEVCGDYVEMMDLRKHYYDGGQDKFVARIRKRLNTIAREQVLSFLSRKAVIPKYGFPVDVVELDTYSQDGRPTGVTLQRDLSSAIAEYAPGGKVVAKKLEWESCGVKKVPGKEWHIRYYQYNDARSFTQWNEEDQTVPPNRRKYLIPEFGFVTPLFKPPTKPHGRTRRLYTTRPFFRGFDTDIKPVVQIFSNVQITKASPGILVILCEGRNKEGFFICRSCGAHMTSRQVRHKSPWNSECQGTLELFSLGHELVTDVVRVQFPRLHDEWIAYSVAYGILLGTAETLNVPDTDLNVTITGGANQNESAIVLYDNVPGGAGLVAQLEQKIVFDEMIRNARERVEGKCGCDSSCYGCLRSYRNQFAHPHLNRKRAFEILNSKD